MLKQVPSVHTAYYLKHNYSVDKETKTGQYIPARPLAFTSNIFVNIWNRLKVAFNVFIGKYDALYWEDEDDR